MSPAAGASTRAQASISRISTPIPCASGSGGTTRPSPPASPSRTRWRSRRSARTACPTCASCSCAASTSAASPSTPTSTSAKARQLEAHPAAAAAFGWLQLHRQVRVRGPVERVSDAEADAYFASRPRGSRDRRLGLAAEPGADRRPRRARCARARADRVALPRRGRAPARSSGAASASCPPRSSSGRAGRAGCTIACATAARAPPGRSSASRPDPGRNRSRGRAPRVRRPAPRFEPARPCRG